MATPQPSLIPVVEDSPVNIIVRVIASQPDIDKTKLLNSLTSSSKFKQYLLQLKTLVIATESVPLKLGYLSVLLHMIILKSDPFQDLMTVQIQEFAQWLINFTTPINNAEDQTLFEEVIDLILDKLNFMTEDEILQFLTQPIGANSSLFVAHYMLKHLDQSKQQPFHIVVTHFDINRISNYYALGIVLSQHVITELNEENVEFVHQNGIPSRLSDILIPIFESQNPVAVIGGLHLLKGCFHFLSGDDSNTLFISILDKIINLIHSKSPEVRTEVAAAISALPVECKPEIFSVEAQLNSVSLHLCQEIKTFNSPYTESLLPFISARKEDSHLPTLINLLTNSEDTRRGALLFVIGCQLHELPSFRDVIPKVFSMIPPNISKSQFDRISQSEHLRNEKPQKDNKVDPDFVALEVLCNHVSDTIQAITYALTKNKFSKELFKEIAKSIFASMSLPPTIIFGIKSSLIEAIPKFVSFYPTYPEEFVTALTNSFIQCKDIDICSIFRDSILNINFSDVSGSFNNTPEFIPFIIRLLRMNYERIFSYESCNTRSDLLFESRNEMNLKAAILNLFKPSEPINIRDSNRIPNLAELVDKFTTSLQLEALKREAMTKLQQDKSYAISAAVLPNLSDSDIDKVYNVALLLDSNGLLDNVICNCIFIALSQRYFNQTLARLLIYSRSQKPKTHIIIKKKKTAMLSVRNGILFSVSAIICNNFNTNPNNFNQETQPQSVSLTNEQQDRLLDVIEGVLPDPSQIQDYADSAAKISKVIPYLSLATASKKLINKTSVVPLFAECLPQLLSKITGTEDIIDSVANCWAYHLDYVSIARDMNQTIVDLCFKLLPSANTLKTLLNVFSNYFNRPDPLPFVNFCRLAALKASEGQLFTDLSTASHFVLCLSPLTLSSSPDVQYDATQTIFTLFNIPQLEKAMNDPATSKSSGEVIDDVRKMFTQAFTAGGEGLIGGMMAELAKVKIIEIHHAILLEGMIQAKPMIVVSPQNVKPFVEFLETVEVNIKQSKGRSKPLFFIENALLNLSRSQMNAFLPLILFNTSSTHFRNVFLTKLMNSPSHRDLFIEAYHSIVQMTALKSSPQVRVVFSILPQIIDSEPSQELSPHTFATITADMLIWLTAILTSSINKKSGEQLETAFSKACQRLPIYSLIGLQPLQVDCSDFAHFSETINQLCVTFSTLPISRIESLSSFIFTFVQTKSQNPDDPNPVVDPAKESLALTGALFFVHMAALFERFTTDQASEFRMKLYNGIGNAFLSLHGSRVRQLAKVADSVLYPPALRQLPQSMMPAIITSLFDISDKNDFRPTVHFLVSLLAFPDFRAMINRQQILDIIRNTLNPAVSNMKFEIWQLGLLEAYSEKQPVIDDLLNKNRSFDLDFLFRCLAFDNIEVRKTVRKCIRQIIGEESFVAAITRVAGEKKVAELGEGALGSLKKETIDEEWMGVLKDMERVLIDSRLPESISFKNSLLKFVLPIASDKSSGLQDQAEEILKILVN